MAFTVSGRDGWAIWKPDKRVEERARNTVCPSWAVVLTSGWNLREKILLLFYFTQEMVVGRASNDDVCVSGDWFITLSSDLNKRSIDLPCGAVGGWCRGELIGRSSGRWHTYQIIDHPRTIGWWLCFIFYLFSTGACNVLFIFFSSG